MANSHMTFGVDLLPKTNAQYNLGNSNQKWNLYVNEINGQAFMQGQPVYYVKGPSTDTTAGTWTGTISGITALSEGLTIIYQPAIAGSTSTLLNINNLGAKQCVATSGTLGTQYKAGDMILFTYNGSQWVTGDYAGYDSVDNTKKFYLVGTDTSSTNDRTGEHYFDQNIYATTTAGEISAVNYSLNASGVEKAYITYNTNNDSIEFNFI